MTHIMSSSSIFTSSVLVAVLLAAGCSKQYEHKRLSRGCPEFLRVQQMLQELREAPADGLDAVLSRQVAAGLSNTQQTGVRFILGELARAKEVHIERLDRWGEGIYRATIKFTAASSRHTVAMLLVAEGDELYWAGTN